MDMNEYVFEVVVRDRQAELLRAAERSYRVRDGHRVAHPLRVALGRALVRIGRRLQGFNTVSGRRRGPGGAIDTQGGPTYGAVRG